MTHKKEKLLAALLTSRTKKDAAKAAGISERTMRAYFDDPEFPEYNGDDSWGDEAFIKPPQGGKHNGESTWRT